MTTLSRQNLSKTIFFNRKLAYTVFIKFWKKALKINLIETEKNSSEF